MSILDHHNKARREPVKATLDVIHKLICDVALVPGAELEIRNTSNGLKAYFIIGRKPVYVIPILVEVHNQEDALPLADTIEADEILGVIQQRYPGFAWGWNQEAKPRMRTHSHDAIPKLRATKRRPFSDRTFNRTPERRRRSSSASRKPKVPAISKERVPWANLSIKKEQ